MEAAVNSIIELEKKFMKDIKQLCKDFYISGYLRCIKDRMEYIAREPSISFEEEWSNLEK